MPVNVRCTHFPILFAVVSKNSYAFLLPMCASIWAWDDEKLTNCNDAMMLSGLLKLSNELKLAINVSNIYNGKIVL